MAASKAVAWSFWWPCHFCDGLRLHLVNEIPGSPVLARCERCTTLVHVSDAHRAGRQDQKKSC